MMGSSEQKDAAEKVAEQVTVLQAVSGEYMVLALSGKMVYENADLFAKALEAKIQKKGCYIFDVDKLARLDSTGFGVLVIMAKKISSLEGQVGFVVSNEFLKELFDIAKFDYIFPIAASHEVVWQIIKDGFRPRISLTQY